MSSKVAAGERCPALLRCDGTAVVYEQVGVFVEDLTRMREDAEGRCAVCRGAMPSSWTAAASQHGP